MRLVECVPNFSEGRDKAKIKTITAAIEAVDGVRLLDVDPGFATNRTVVTFVGSPEQAVEAAFAGIRTAAEIIDMRNHKGAHARQGATDVCPFIPLTGVTMDECIELAKTLGKKVGEELGIPVYLYEEAASAPHRRNLAVLRQGEYEGLAEKFKQAEMLPDFGEPLVNPKSGATVIGAREFLIAYNINLNTKDAKLAGKIATLIREQSKLMKDDNGKPILDEQGNKTYSEGLLKYVKATGWYIAEYKTAQVSVNLTNYRRTPLHELVETTRRVALDNGLIVTGSELVGLIPREAILEAGKYYLNRMNRSSGISEEELVEIAVRSLGLNELYPFDPKQKIIEYRISEPAVLVGTSLREFTNTLASDAPAPGGGSVAALCGALSAGLSTMVANLTFSKKGFNDVKNAMLLTAEEGQVRKDEYLLAVDADTKAFNEVMAAYSAPEKQRQQAIETTTLKATEVPLAVLRGTLRLTELADFVARNGNPNSISDAGVAASTARTCAEGAYLNVMINLPGLSDKAFKERTANEARSILNEVRTRTAATMNYVEGVINNS